MYEKLDTCPVCGKDKFSNYFICKDHVVSGESFALSLCENCKLIFTNPRPAKELIANYYDSKDYTPHSEKKSIVNLIYRLVRTINNRGKIKLISKYSGKGKILDVGCGTGNFLKSCRNNGWIITGVEPVVSAANYASEILGIPVLKDIFSIEEGTQFDVITFWHVLEHIYNIDEVIEKAKSHLSKNGRIFFALPNNKSYDCESYKEHWAAFDVPRHLYHFNIESFSYFTRDHGLKIQDIIPMPFDAYYVSLLSEKYKTNRRKWIKSFISGYKSNSYAKKNQNNFSSLIYVVKK